MKPWSIMRRRSEAMTWLRSMMLLCSCSRRRSRKRYFSRSSSGVVSFSTWTGIGRVSAIDWTTISAASSSISPVARRGLTVAACAGHHLAGHRDHAFAAYRLGDPEDRAGAVHDDLRHAVVVAQVDEQQVAVVALALHPARKAGLVADMLGPQLAARVGSIDGRHHAFSTGRRGGKGHGLGRQVKQLGLSARATFAPRRRARYRSAQ